MPWMTLKFAPGIIKDSTRYAAGGTWYDGSLVRFRGDYPEAWAGWVRSFNGLEMYGVCRSINRFSDLSGNIWHGLGTNYRFYISNGDTAYDVTPQEDPVALGTDPFSIAGTVMTVTHTNHGRFPGDTVTFAGSADVGAVTAAEINSEFIIATLVDEDTYTVNLTTSETATGGGASVTATYNVLIGGPDQPAGGLILDAGWSGLTWGEEEWGDNGAGLSLPLGQWTQDNWGEDLVACVKDGGIYYWDATNPEDRMVNILDLAGADGNAPSYARFIVVSSRDRHLLAFGGDEFSTGNPAPLTVRWCNQENILDWDEASTTGTAGSLPLSKGTRFISAIDTTREILVWSDRALFSLRYVGAPYIYVHEVIDHKSDIMGMRAAAISEGVVYWMGKTGFYAYSGRVEIIESPVWDYILSTMDLTQNEKVFAATIRAHDEVIWFYPDKDEGENTRYVTLNTKTGAWAVGMLARSAWLDGDSIFNPLGISPTSGIIFEHEVGVLSEEDSEDGSPVDAYVESAPFELSSEGAYDKGDRFMFIRRIFHDVTFRNKDYTDEPTMNIVLKTMDKPGGGFADTSSSQVVRSATIPVEEFTEESHVRLRGRSLSIRAETSATASLWRLGAIRIDARPDGQR